MNWVATHTKDSHDHGLEIHPKYPLNTDLWGSSHAVSTYLGDHREACLPIRPLSICVVRTSTAAGIMSDLLILIRAGHNQKLDVLAAHSSHIKRQLGESPPRIAATP